MIARSLARLALIASLGLMAGTAMGQMPKMADPAAPAAEATAEDKAKVLAPKAEDIGLGNPNAPVRWVEYASSGCGHCARLSLEILPQLKAAYIDTGKVYYVLRDFPLDNASLAASLLARCMPKEKFYPFMEVLFRDQAQWHSPEVTDPAAVLVSKAKEAGLSDADIEACKNNQAVLDRIVASRTEANEVLKVDSTPTNFINGERVQGVVPAAEFEAVIKKALDQPAP